MFHFKISLADGRVLVIPPRDDVETLRLILQIFSGTAWEEEVKKAVIVNDEHVSKEELKKILS